ncbi:(4Fe-4S)-binding protein [Robiginitalea sp. SC105]|uniref:(4Fe-4S)-binding protein n=1 Tax=Robiginitalea sp. SC105 TaxID=2762332 RepID=UPI00163A0644|nr:(4Fe-4S)-binding protein [Robiginitalea sp. SC105]MBC2840378.1 (4Fe-4S)-binding protein [Robiginitalea sp. SC105]
MSEREIVKEYSKGDFHVIWKPRKCIHSKVCVQALPDVYRPEEKPWIRPEHASVKALRDQIDRCPSGALSYRDNSAAEEGSDSPGVRAQVVKGGPLLVRGIVELETEGEGRRLEGSTAFCRCGASGNKPFCDGSHKKVDFEH